MVINLNVLARQLYSLSVKSLASMSFYPLLSRVSLSLEIDLGELPLVVILCNTLSSTSCWYILAAAALG